MSSKFSKIKFGDGLSVDDEGDGVILVSGGGGGGGIQYDTQPQTGEYVWIETTGHAGSSVPGWGGFSLWEGGYGIEINSYGGDVDLGEAVIELEGDDGIQLTTNNSITTGPFDGHIYLGASGPSASILFDSDNDFNVTAEGEMRLDIDDFIGIWCNNGSLDMGAYGGYFYLYADTDIILDCSGSGNLKLDGLPTSSPGGSGAVWNDSGTLKIT